MTRSDDDDDSTGRPGGHHGPFALTPIGSQRFDIEYQPGVHLSVHEPDECSDEERPAIVTSGPDSARFAEELPGRGYVVVDVAARSPGYTGAISAGTLRAFAYSVGDLGTAVQWLRAHAEEICVDTEAIAAIGYSFGAITALSLGYSDTDLVAGAVITVDELGGAATVDEAPEPPQELAHYSNDVAAIVSFSGFALSDTIEAGEPPALLFHGRDDGIIPFGLAERTCAAATTVGVGCEIVPHDSGHVMAPNESLAFDRVDEFLRQQLASDGGPPGL